MTRPADVADTIASVARNRQIAAPTLRMLWLSLPVFMLLLKAFLFPLPLLDFWWHLRMGKIILETHSIPSVDLFSFTAAGQPFVVQNWVAEIILYLTYRAGGFALLIFLNAALLVATLLPVYRLCRSASESLWPGVLSASMVAVGMVCNLRPQVFSFLLFAVFYWLLSDFCSRRRDRIWLLPLLMIFWVNLHGAFVVGLVLIAIHVFAELMRMRWNTSPGLLFDRKKLNKLILVFGCCMVATLANPETYRIFDYVRTVMQDPSSQRFVVEWQPPAIAGAQGIFLFYLPFFLVTLSMMFSKRRPDLTETALYLVFSVFGLTAARNSVWFLLAAAPILARHMSLLDRASIPIFCGRSLQAGRHEPGNSNATRPRKQYPAMNLAIALAAVTILFVQSPWLQSGLNGTGLLDAKTPVGAMNYVEMHPIQGNIFHPQIYGDYLIWRLWPKCRSFIDGRVHVFGEALVRDYQKIYRDSRWEDLLQTYGIRYLLLSKQEDPHEGRNRIEDARKSADWKILYEDDRSVLFEKSTGPQITTPF